MDPVRRTILRCAVLVPTSSLPILRSRRADARRPIASISGTIKRPDGVPVALATVRLLTWQGQAPVASTMTAFDGTYSLPVPRAGTYLVTFWSGIRGDIEVYYPNAAFPESATVIRIGRRHRTGVDGVLLHLGARYTNVDLARARTKRARTRLDHAAAELRRRKKALRAARRGAGPEERRLEHWVRAVELQESRVTARRRRLESATRSLRSLF